MFCLDLKLVFSFMFIKTLKTQNLVNLSKPNLKFFTQS